MRRWLSILGVATLAVACADDEAASPAADATVIGGEPAGRPGRATVVRSTSGSAT